MSAGLKNLCILVLRTKAVLASGWLNPCHPTILTFGRMREKSPTVTATLDVPVKIPGYFPFDFCSVQSLAQPRGVAPIDHSDSKNLSPLSDCLAGYPVLTHASLECTCHLTH